MWYSNVAVLCLLLSVTAASQTVEERRAQLWNPPVYPLGLLDTDRDGIPDQAETAGWTAVLDLAGFGEGVLTLKAVTSDPR